MMVSKSTEMNEIQLKVCFESVQGSSLQSGNEGALSVIAGEAGTWLFHIVNQGTDMLEGTRVRLFITDIQMAHKVQKEYPKRRDYVTLECDGGSIWHVQPGNVGYKDMITLKLEQGKFCRGERLCLRLGDRRYGGTGSEAFWSTTTGTVQLELAAHGDVAFLRCAAPTRIHIVPSPRPALIRLLGPTVARTGEAVRLHLGVFDRNGNVAEPYRGQVHFQADESIEGLPVQVMMEESDRGLRLFEGVRFSKPGVYRIPVSCGDKELRCVSNPIVVEDAPEQFVYWGDLHCHSWGDCTMMLMNGRTRKVDPLRRHQQAFYAGRLDFAAPGPMSFPREDREAIWNVHREAVKSMDRPGEYVPFLSYEAHPSLPGPSEGDRQVIFYAADEPLPPDYALPMKQLEALYGHRDDCILQVHIGGSAPKWELYQPEREQMVEVSSGFGNAEWLLRKALRLGYKPAVCGCSDLHLGLLGGPRAVEPFRGRFGKAMRIRDSAFGQGPLTAVNADALTRASIWDGLKRRATYATSGERVYLSFQCNGVNSGGIAAASSRCQLKIRYFGTAPILSVDLIAGDKTVKSIRTAAPDWEGELIFERQQLPGDWMYVRVTQTDGNMAWCSPVWLDTELSGTGSGTEADESSISECRGYLKGVVDYLQREEDPSLFHHITPVGMRQETLVRCALFHCRFGKARNPMTIRWYYEYAIPRIRLDWGYGEEGERNCETDSLELAMATKSLCRSTHLSQ